MNSDCLFCKIVAGEIPAAKVYEDAHTLAFLDINPVKKGHVLVIPKQHHAKLIDTPPDVLRHVIVSARTVARAQMKGLGAIGLNVSQANGEVAGQVIPHIHFHLIPRYEQDREDRNWHPGSYDDADEMMRFAEMIRQAMDV